MRFRQRVARFLAPEFFEDVEMQVNQRVADVLLKMDPFDPLIRKYNVVFSDKWDEKPEQSLGSIESTRLFMWAYGIKSDPSFLHLVDWLRNQQGNATLRKASNEKEWFFGRAAVATITLLVEEIGRLSSHYEEIMFNRNKNFDVNLPVGEY